MGLSTHPVHSGDSPIEGQYPGDPVNGNRALLRGLFSTFWGWKNQRKCVIIIQTNCSISGTFEKRSVMLTNNIEIDVKTRCIEEKVSQQQLADDIGTSGTYVSRLIKHQDKIVNKTFIAMMERLGYDVELRYVRRDGEI